MNFHTIVTFLLAAVETQFMPPRYRIEYDREGCIGAGSCAAVDATHFLISDKDGKADLVKSEKTTDVKEEKKNLFIFETDDITDLKAAAEACPVNVIRIIDKKTGDRVV